jgi:hypothetical protein
MYGNQNALIFMRNLIATAAVLAGSAWLMAFALLLPRPLGAWTAAPAVWLVALAVALSYRAPAPFLPAWLRSDIDSGVVSVARPSRTDWVLFWMVVPLLLVGPLALVALTLVPGGVD